MNLSVSVQRFARRTPAVPAEVAAKTVTKGGATPETRSAVVVLALASVAYILAYLALPPKAVLVTDEAIYIAQATAFAHGETTVSHRLPDGTTKETLPSLYPVGTSLLQAPLVRLGGWKYAALLSAISLVGLLVSTALLLREEGYSLWFALSVLLYAPTLVLGRLATSDVPSGFLVALGIWLFWHGQRMEHREGIWFLSGVVAGVSILFRESNAVFLLPFFAGAVFRSSKGWIWILTGGMCGLLVRLGAAWIVYGSPFYVRDYPPFSFSSLPENAVFYLIVLTLLIPMGLPCVLAYRGRLRPEVIMTVAVALVFFSAYSYSGQASGLAARIIVGPRFFIPLTPILALGIASYSNRLRIVHHVLAQPTFAIISALIVLTAVVAVHVGLERRSQVASLVVQEVYERIRPNALVITNPAEAQPYLNDVYGTCAMVAIDSIDPCAPSPPSTDLVVFDRFDSDFHRGQVVRNQAFIDSALRCRPLSPVLDRQRLGLRIRIWRVGRVASGAQ